MYRVWVPNDAGILSIASDELTSERLPEEVFYIDEDNLADAYALFYTKAKALDDESKRIEDGIDADDAPDDTGQPSEVIPSDFLL